MTIRRGLLIYTSVIYLIGAILVVLLVNSHMRGQALTEAESKAMLVLDRNLATHAFYTHQLKPRIFEWSEPFRTPEYFEPTWMSATYAVREIDRYFKTLSHNDYYYRECAINALSPQNEADSTENAFIRALNDDPALMKQSMIRVMDGKQYFQTRRRGEMMEETCLRRHSTPDKAPADLVRIYGPTRSFNRQEGEAITAISIRIPLSAAYAEADRFSVWLSGLLICMLLGIYVGQHQINRFWLLRSLEMLRTKVTEIAGNPRLLGETLPMPRGQELQYLGAAFNTLSKALKESLDQLEDRVTDRTRELNTVNIRLKQEMIQREKLTTELIKSKKREAMPSGGVIILSAENRGILPDEEPPVAGMTGDRFVQITIRDQGEGIPAKNLSRIFDPYFSTRDRFTQKGMGLGLSIAYVIIQKHGGYITVESLLNVGTTVSIFLPA